jgi:hypothetical protein
LLDDGDEEDERGGGDAVASSEGRVVRGIHLELIYDGIKGKPTGRLGGVDVSSPTRKSGGMGYPQKLQKQNPPAKSMQVGVDPEIGCKSPRASNDQRA